MKFSLVSNEYVKLHRWTQIKGKSEEITKLALEAQKKNISTEEAERVEQLALTLLEEIRALITEQKDSPDQSPASTPPPHPHIHTMLQNNPLAELSPPPPSILHLSSPSSSITTHQQQVPLSSPPTPLSRSENTQTSTSQSPSAQMYPHSSSPSQVYTHSTHVPVEFTLTQLQQLHHFQQLQQQYEQQQQLLQQHQLLQQQYEQQLQQAQQQQFQYQYSSYLDQVMAHTPQQIITHPTNQPQLISQPAIQSQLLTQISQPVPFARTSTTPSLPQQQETKQEKQHKK